MNKIILLAIISILLLNPPLGAQTPPDVDLKNANSGFGLDPSKAIAGLKLDFSNPKALAGVSLNFEPISQMLALLEGKGAKVEARVQQMDGLNILEIKVDGKLIDPVAISCNDCVIVYEY